MKECTNGEWPCEMSTYIAAVEAENQRLKLMLVEIDSHIKCAHLDMGGKHKYSIHNVIGGRHFYEVAGRMKEAISQI